MQIPGNISSWSHPLGSRKGRKHHFYISVLLDKGLSQVASFAAVDFFMKDKQNTPLTETLVSRTNF